MVSAIRRTNMESNLINMMVDRYLLRIYDGALSSCKIKKLLFNILIISEEFYHINASIRLYRLSVLTELSVNDSTSYKLSDRQITTFLA